MQNEVLKLTDQAKVLIMKRVVANDGKIAQDDAAALSLFCRLGEGETGAAYPFFSAAAVKDWDGALAHASSSGGATNS